MFCPSCNSNIADGSRFCTVCGHTLSSTPAPLSNPGLVTAEKGVNLDFSNNTTTVSASSAAMKRYEYKVLSQKDKWFSGKFDPLLLEQAINAYAQQGWRVVGCATADIAGFGGSRQEFIALLEREA